MSAYEDADGLSKVYELKNEFTSLYLCFSTAYQDIYWSK